MSPSSPQPDFKGQDLHTLVQAARRLKSEHDENPEYDRALVELIFDTTAPMPGFDADQKRAVIQRLLAGKPREFEIRGRIVIDYAMGFSEAEAIEWFPGARWSEQDTSHAGNIETDCLQDVGIDFWHCVSQKREIVVDEVTHINHVGEIRDEITAVVEL